MFFVIAGFVGSLGGPRGSRGVHEKRLGALGGTPGCLSGFGFDPEDRFFVICKAFLYCFSSGVVLLGLLGILGIMFFVMRGLARSFGGPGGSRDP